MKNMKEQYENQQKLLLQIEQERNKLEEDKQKFEEHKKE